MAMERTGEYRGRYHVLLGALSPLDGIGPDELKVRELLAPGRGEPHPRDHPGDEPERRGRRDRALPVQAPAPARAPRHADRARSPGRGRPRVRGRGDAVPGARGTAGDVSRRAAGGATCPVKNRSSERPTDFIPSQIASPNPLALSWRRSPAGLASLPALLGPLPDLLGALGHGLADALGRLLDALADLLRALDHLVGGLGRLGVERPGAPARSRAPSARPRARRLPADGNVRGPGMEHLPRRAAPYGDCPAILAPAIDTRARAA